MYGYTSEITNFLNDIVDKNPKLQEERLKNRKILWDVNLNLQEQKGFKKSEVERKPYVYQYFDI